MHIHTDKTKLVHVIIIVVVERIEKFLDRNTSYTNRFIKRISENNNNDIFTLETTSYAML